MRASLSLDLDNLWSYQKTHGDLGWTDYPSYLEQLVPHVMALAGNAGVGMTVFIVGQDAAFDHNRELLAELAGLGEVGNHSYRHEPWIHTYQAAEVVDELKQAHEAIADATGSEAKGFRGPGFSVSPAILQTLADMGYRYDASTLPTWIGPLARRYYFRSTSLTDEQQQQRSALFGSVSDGLKPNVAYQWELTGRRLAEIPVTTFPLARVPIHVSYLLYLSRFSVGLAQTYLRLALLACRGRRAGPSVLLHPLDLLGGDEVPDLEFFPGMDMEGAVKRHRTASFVRMLTASFTVGTMAEHLADLEPLTKSREP